MKIVEMQLKPSEAKKETVEASELERPLYPYGLCLYLDEVALAKLGITEMPEVGCELQIAARGRVTGTSQREYEGGSHQTLDIQIVAMGCEDAGEEEPETGMGKAAKKLYGG